MKKLFIALVLGLLLVAALATVASADNGPHGGFTATTDACASCHRIHTAQSGANNLLRVPTTELCLSCHSGTFGASTNVHDGVYTTSFGNMTEGTNLAPLMGGGFTNALMSTNTSGVASTSVTSSHTVDSVGTVWGSGSPTGTGSPAGGNYGQTGFTLECTSCHDPHGNAGYANTTPTTLPAGPAVTIAGGLTNACDPTKTNTNPCTVKVASYRLLRWQPQGSNGFSAPATTSNWSGGAFPTNGATNGWTVPDTNPGNGSEWYSLTVASTTAFAGGPDDYMPGNDGGNVYTNATKDYRPALMSMGFFCAQCHDRYFNNGKLRNNGSGEATKRNGTSDQSARCGRPSDATLHTVAGVNQWGWILDGQTSLNAAALDTAPGTTYSTQSGRYDPVSVTNPVHPLYPNDCTAIYNVKPTTGATGAKADAFIGWADTRKADDIFMYRHNSGDVRGSNDGAWNQSATAFTSVGKTCLTCHVAHGTAASAMTATLVADPINDPDNDGNSLAGDSVLLRMDGRTICLRCHASSVNYVNSVGTATWP
jgi:predicted CXXCH cytochrome family protein